MLSVGYYTLDFYTNLRFLIDTLLWVFYVFLHIIRVPYIFALLNFI